MPRQHLRALFSDLLRVGCDKAALAHTKDALQARQKGPHASRCCFEVPFDEASPDGIALGSVPH